jgi:hypothetical protein
LTHHKVVAVRQHHFNFRLDGRDMFFLIIVQRAEGFQRIDHTPGIKTAIDHTRCLDGGNQCLTLLVIQCVGTHHRCVHEPEPQMMGGHPPETRDDLREYRSDRWCATVGIPIEFDQKTNLTRAQVLRLQPPVEVRYRRDLRPVVEKTAGNGTANA